MRLSCSTSPFSMSAKMSSSVRRPRDAAASALRSRACRRSAICRATRSSATTRKLSPASGHGGEAEHLNRPRRAGLVDVSAVLVEHGAHAAEGVAGDDRVADAQRAALDQHGGDRTTTTVEVRLDRDTLRVLVRVGPQVERRVRGQQDRLEQRVDAGALLGRDVDEHRLAAVLLGDQAVLGELGPRTLVGSAPSLSILLTATTIGTSAAWAWLSASIVCGLTPSSAATTRTAMSVTCAPRARMAVNAS